MSLAQILGQKSPFGGLCKYVRNKWGHANIPMWNELDWSAPDFWKNDFDKLHFWSISNLMECVACKIQLQNRPVDNGVGRNPFFDYSIFQKSSADQQGDRYR